MGIPKTPETIGECPAVAKERGTPIISTRATTHLVPCQLADELSGVASPQLPRGNAPGRGHYGAWGEDGLRLHDGALTHDGPSAHEHLGLDAARAQDAVGFYGHVVADDGSRIQARGHSPATGYEGRKGEEVGQNS